MAFSHHNTTQHNQGRGAKGKFFGSQDGRQDNIAPGFKLAVGLQADTSAQVVQQQGLVGFGDPEFKRQPSMFDRALWAGPSPAIITADDDIISVGFGNSRSNRADASFGDQFDTDPRIRGWRS